jgi:hypothetical protein
MAEPVPQAGPYTARTYDGTTPEKSFNWKTPEGAALQDTAADFSTLLTIIRNTLAAEDDSASKGQHLLAVLLAKGYDSLDNLPPFPLQGAHASIKSSTLAVTMGAWVAMEIWLNSPQTFPVQTTTGTTDVTAVPLALFRKLMPAGGVK